MTLKTKINTNSGLGDLDIIMGNVHALVETLLPSDEFGDIAMTPKILSQIADIQNAVCDALRLPHMPIIPPSR